MPSAEIAIHAAIPPLCIDQNGLRVREDVLYTDTKGRDKTKLHRRADDVFESLREVLLRVLEPNETVFYVAGAQAMPSAGAQLFGGGWHTYSLPRTVLFFTERRIIALRVRKRMSGWDWNRGIRTVRWGDVESATSGGSLNPHLTLKFRNGQKQLYWRFARGDLKKIRLLIDILRPHGSGETTSTGAMVSLCPVCLAVLSPGQYQCSSCGLQFKDEKTLIRRGILIPGGASFYVGAPVLGSLRFVSESIFLLVLILYLVFAMVAPAGSKDTAFGFVGALFVFGILSLDKTMAILYARPQIRDFLPIK